MHICVSGLSSLSTSLPRYMVGGLALRCEFIYESSYVVKEILYTQFPIYCLYTMGKFYWNWFISLAEWNGTNQKLMLTIHHEEIDGQPKCLQFWTWAWFWSKVFTPNLYPFSCTHIPFSHQTHSFCWTCKRVFYQIFYKYLLHCNIDVNTRMHISSQDPLSSLH